MALLVRMAGGRRRLTWDLTYWPIEKDQRGHSGCRRSQRAERGRFAHHGGEYGPARRADRGERHLDGARSPTDTLVPTWLAAPPCDSPTDAYRITISGSDGGGPLSQTLGPSLPSARFAVSVVPDWAVQVQAHDAAGWGPMSVAFTLGGA